MKGLAQLRQAGFRLEVSWKWVGRVHGRFEEPRPFRLLVSQGDTLNRLWRLSPDNTKGEP